MAAEKKTDIIQAGAMIRRSFRTQLAVLAAQGHLTFTEDKGLLDSRFIVTASPEVWGHINKVITALNAR